MSTSPNTPRSTNQTSSITRRRTGCIPCRDKHVRCDEKKPSCRRCERSNTDCFWTRGLKIVFQGPEGVTSTSTPPTQATAPPTGSASPSCLLERRRQSMNSNTDSAQKSKFISSLSILSPPISEHDTEPDIADVKATHVTAALTPNQEHFTNWSNLEASDLVQKALRTNLETTLMHNYLTECAPWFDAHSARLYYSRVEVPRMLRCPPWRAAALALSAKNIELREHRALTSGSESLPLHLYQMAVRLAIEAMSGRFEVVGTLAGCVLLCVYEMMTVTYTDWRRHVQGCASIHTHNGWNGSTGGLISGCFWDYARIDIWAAFCASTTTILPPDTYFDNAEATMALNGIDEDLHACIAIWITARAINLISDNPPLAGSGAILHSLQADMTRWEVMGGQSAQPVQFRDASAEADNPFPQILFSSHSATIGHTQFYTAKVLLLEYEAAQRSTEAAASLREEAYKYALMANGIVETNDHTACLVNSLQPVYVCGRHMRTRSEKFATRIACSDRTKDRLEMRLAIGWLARVLELVLTHGRDAYNAVEYPMARWVPDISFAKVDWWPYKDDCVDRTHR